MLSNKNDKKITKNVKYGKHDFALRQIKRLEFKVKKMKFDEIYILNKLILFKQ